MVPPREPATRARDTEPLIYCVVPRELVPILLERLHDHFRSDRGVEVVAEMRERDRRRRPERRTGDDPEVEGERRRVRNRSGRRVGDRRSALEPAVLPRPLPPEAQPYAARLILFERRAPRAEDVDDLEAARLVVRFQAGEEEVFSELYLRYFDRVYVYLSIALSDDREAEDATQDVFMKVMGALPRYERRGRPFRAWLFTVVRNLALDRLRRRQRVEVTDPLVLRGVADEEGADAAPALGWISDRRLGALIERLPVAQRQVVVLRYMLDLGVPEIAQVMDLEPGHVSVLHHRAMQFLRERLGAQREQENHGAHRTDMRRRISHSPVMHGRSRALVFGVSL